MAFIHFIMKRFELLLITLALVGDIGKPSYVFSITLSLILSCICTKRIHTVVMILTLYSDVKKFEIAAQLFSVLEKIHFS